MLHREDEVMGANGLQNWQNRTLFHGDNLPFLRGMNSNSVHLIATDPPFNKNRDFHATPDSLADGASFQDRWSWERDVHEEWVDQIKDDFPHVMEVINGSRASYGDDMGAFLCFMGVRLLEMKRVLREGGSIYQTAAERRVGSARWRYRRTTSDQRADRLRDAGAGANRRRARSRPISQDETPCRGTQGSEDESHGDVRHLTVEAGAKVSRV